MKTQNNISKNRKKEKKKESIKEVTQYKFKSKRMVKKNTYDQF